MSECSNSIKVFPIRYTVVKKIGSSKSDYSYSNDNLEKGYPKLKHSTYTTRLLRQGFLYYYDNKKILKVWMIDSESKFSALTATTRKPGQNLSKYTKGQAKDFIAIGEKVETAWLAYSDTLWTPQKYDDMDKDKDGIVDKIMTKVDIKEWKKAPKNESQLPSNQKNILTIYETISVLEETKYQNFKNKIKISLSNLLKPAKGTVIETVITDIKKAIENNTKANKTADKSSIRPSGKDILNAMGKMCSEEYHSMGVVLYDNIGLVEDQTDIISGHNKKLQTYVQDKDRLWKKQAAGLISSVYEAEAIKSEEDRDNLPKRVDQLEKKMKGYKEAKYAQTPNPRANKIINKTVDSLNEEAKKYYSSIEDGFTPREMFIKEKATRSVSHINEKARMKFIKEYDEKIKDKTVKLMQAKSDRYEHLKTYLKTDKPTDLGSSFLVYDTDNIIHCIAHSQSFANCISYMMTGVFNKVWATLFGGDKEAKLFKEWWKSEKTKNPILQNLALDIHLTEEEKSVLIGSEISNTINATGVFLGVYNDKKTNDINDIKNRNEALAKKPNSKQIVQMRINVANNNAALQNAKKNIKVRTVALQNATAEISNNIFTFVFKNWSKGTTTQNLEGLSAANKHMSKLLVSGNTKEILNIIAGQNRISKYSQHFEVATITVEECMKQFSEEVNISYDKKSILKVASEEFEILKVVVSEKNHNIDFAKTEFAKIELLTDKLKKSVERLEKTVKDLKLNEKSIEKNKAEIEKIKLTPKNIFSSHIGGAVTIYSLYSSIVNLKSSVINLSEKMDKASFATFMAGCYSVAGSAISTFTLAKSIGSARFPRFIAPSSAARALALDFSGKMFGVASSIYEGLAEGFKSFKQIGLGNTSAAIFYGMAGACLLAGGVAITYAGAIASFFAIGVVVVIAFCLAIIALGSWLSGLGKDKEYKPIEYWLAACKFGKGREEYKNDDGKKDKRMLKEAKPKKKIPYPNAKEEIEDFNKIFEEEEKQKQKQKQNNSKVTLTVREEGICKSKSQNYSQLYGYCY